MLTPKGRELALSTVLEDHQGKIATCHCLWFFLLGFLKRLIFTLSESREVISQHLSYLKFIHHLQSQTFLPCEIEHHSKLQILNELYFTCSFPSSLLTHFPEGVQPKRMVSGKILRVGRIIHGFLFYTPKEDHV